MANACGLFGDLIPNVYIDRVFLEESLQKTENGARGGSTTVETPTISIGLKVIDTPSANGTLSILGEALQIESANSTLDFKDFMKVHCGYTQSTQMNDVKASHFFCNEGTKIVILPYRAFATPGYHPKGIITTGKILIRHHFKGSWKN